LTGDVGVARRSAPFVVMARVTMGRARTSVAPDPTVPSFVAFVEVGAGFEGLS
jgi:hypothetical protein